MDFALTDEQAALRDEILRFARGELNDGIIDRDTHEKFSREGWHKCAKMGIQGLPFPPEYGGAGADAVTTAVALQALGYACLDHGLLFSMAAQMLSVQKPLEEFGSEEQKQSYLQPMCTGEIIGAHGMSEPGSGSDAFSLTTTAIKDGDRYVLNGTKTFVTNAPVADVFLIFATTDKSAGFLGIGAFIVEKEFPGVSTGKSIGKMGLRTSPMSEVILEDCIVPAANRLGEDGTGPGIFSRGMQWERSMILAFELGIMERQIEACVAHARQRTQFKQPIGSFQSVANMIVDMKVRFETSRLLLYQTSRQLENNELSDMDAAITKLYLSESCVQSSLDAVQIHGGYGYTSEYQIERDLRDAVGGRLYSGTSEIQRNIIARSLGL